MSEKKKNEEENTDSFSLHQQVLWPQCIRDYRGVDEQGQDSEVRWLRPRNFLSFRAPPDNWILFFGSTKKEKNEKIKTKKELIEKTKQKKRKQRKKRPLGASEQMLEKYRSIFSWLFVMKGLTQSCSSSSTEKAWLAIFWSSLVMVMRLERSCFEGVIPSGSKSKLSGVMIAGLKKRSKINPPRNCDRWSGSYLRANSEINDARILFFFQCQREKKSRGKKRRVKLDFMRHFLDHFRRCESINKFLSDIHHAQPILFNKDRSFWPRYPPVFRN